MNGREIGVKDLLVAILFDRPIDEFYGPRVTAKLVGDEAWRHTAVASQVRIEEDGHGGRSCESRPSIDGAWSGCAADELANLPPPQGPLMKLMLFHPYPIIPGLTELPCYS